MGRGGIRIVLQAQPGPLAAGAKAKSERRNNICRTKEKRLRLGRSTGEILAALSRLGAHHSVSGSPLTALRGGCAVSVRGAAVAVAVGAGAVPVSIALYAGGGSRAISPAPCTVSPCMETTAPSTALSCALAR